MPPLSVETTTAAVSAQETPLPTRADWRRPGGGRRLGAVALAGVVMLGVAACGGESSRDAATFPPTVVSDFPATSDGGGETTPGAPSDAGGTTDGGASDGGGTVVANIPKPDPKDYPGMDQHTQEGAEQAFAYYWDLVLWGYQTGDPEPAMAMATENCRNCQSLAIQIADYRQNGGLWQNAKIERGEVESRTSEYDGAEYDARRQVRVAFHDNENNPAEETSVVFYVLGSNIAWKDGEWKMEGGATDTRREEG
ncbi:hypothetical protein JSY14_01545 [Brachybacterium sp. EF45031]|uniref:DUF6318 family protein n=1 Tax=Brachybacterium sillae TaxID=2810536 RepID=UPI00217EEEAD|nr:DUF6318 family protein [Brachybacterium sillae]MCS6710766.1 hypothetical protein [Brachybacterium sillae]